MANIQSVIGWAMGLGPPIAVVAIPAVAALGVSAVFVGFIANMYQRSPEILRCFMGYIVDLTLILEQIFLVTLSKASSPLTVGYRDRFPELPRGRTWGSSSRDSGICCARIVCENRARRRCRGEDQESHLQVLTILESWWRRGGIV
ncbi:hypothetical protein B0H14DRAFT_2719192, partial [Mycena olivaceomarginata]